MKKSIQQIIPSQKVNMGGHIIEQPLANTFLNTQTEIMEALRDAQMEKMGV